MRSPSTSLSKPLTTIDYKILKSLNRNARKPIIEIADDVGLSAKTIKKRLDRMSDNYLASFSIEWAPLYKDSFVSIFHIELNVKTDLNSTIKDLSNKYSQNIVFCASFSNLPNFIMLEIWTNTM